MMRAMWQRAGTAYRAKVGKELTAHGLMYEDALVETEEVKLALSRLPAEVFNAMASRCNPSRDIIVVDNTRGSPFDPSGEAIDTFWRTVGKIGIDATAKENNLADFERAWPVNWGKVKLEDYL